MKKNLTFWVELPTDHEDYSARTKIAENCKTKEKCDQVLSSDLWTKRYIKIAILSGINNIGVSKDFEKLCDPCKNGIFEWYRKEINYIENLGIFQAQIKESNTSEEYRESYEFLSNLIDNPKTAQNEIDSYLQYYQGCKQRFNQAQKLLEEKINESEAIERGYQIE